MKVLLVNGSAHRNGCTYTALEEAAVVLNKESIETEIFQLGNPEIRDCSGCGACRQLDKCVYNDIVNAFVDKAKDFDGFIFGTPVYYAHPSGRLLSFMDRAFFSAPKEIFMHKPGTAIVSARRSGTTATLDQLNKYFTINQMPIISGRYWNMVHGATPEDVVQDFEGMHNMRIVARNMAWHLK